MKLQLFTLVFLFLFAQATTAQVSFGFGFNYTQALKEYQENLHKNPKGLSVNMLYKHHKLPNFRFGLEGGVSMYANDSYTMSWEDESGETHFSEIDEEDCFFSYNANIKYFLVGDQKRVNPYLDARLGAVSFFSTRLSEDAPEALFDDKTHFHGTALMYGVGGGIVARIWQAISLDINVVANRGSHTDYRSIAADDANIKRDLDYGRKESYTPNINYKVGILFGF